MRSLALACAIKGGREIVIIGHTDCVVGRFTTMELIERFRALGIERNTLPENLSEYFGTFASERANVIKAADLVRGSPLISPRMAVHGLLVDIETGKLEWLVDGYQRLGSPVPRPPIPGASVRLGGLGGGLAGGQSLGIKFPEGQIGDGTARVASPVSPATSIGEPGALRWAEHVDIVPPSEPKPPPVATLAPPPVAGKAVPPPKAPLPPRIPVAPPPKRRIYFRR